MFGILVRLFICLMLFGVSPVYAEQYPSKVITIIVPYAAGSPTDTVARLLGKSMGPLLKTQIIIENVVGAGGTIAAAKAAGSAPDGVYTVPSPYRPFHGTTLRTS
jgi:tripartite-type tricarboxylate transporter receptor subunit TctC